MNLFCELRVHSVEAFLDTSDALNDTFDIVGKVIVTTSGETGNEFGWKTLFRIWTYSCSPIVIVEIRYADVYRAGNVRYCLLMCYKYIRQACSCATWMAITVFWLYPVFQIERSSRTWSCFPTMYPQVSININAIRHRRLLPCSRNLYTAMHCKDPCYLMSARVIDPQPPFHSSGYSRL